ncbi:MAG: hypothetical protein KF884_09360 [Fimbriimonadaceae bacterium]|nr:MAG: hypothetical protein KF884_09360 [Fimbriimonadaceae bacterium]
MRNLPRHLALLAAASWFGLAHAEAEPPHVSLSVKFELRPDRDSWDVASQIAQGLGRVTRSNSGGYVILLNDRVGLKQAVEAVRGRKSVQKAEPVEPVFPTQFMTIRSVSKLKALVARWESSYNEYLAFHEKEDKDKSGAGESIDEIPGLDAMGGYLQWLQYRAYPNDTVDLSGSEQLRQFRMTQMGQVPANSALWEFMGPTNLNIPYRTYYGLRPINGRVSALAYHPTQAGTYYKGSDGGVWKTTDSGVNWTPLTDNWPSLEVSSLAIDPVDPNIVYAGTGDHHYSSFGGFGIMKSTDGGQTWSQKGLGVIGNAAVSAIRVLPEDPNIVFATSGNGGGNPGKILRSTDRGETWSQAVAVTTNYCGLSIGANSGSGRIIWAIGSGTPMRIFKSTDNGANWTAVTAPTTGNNGTVGIAASKINPNVAYVLAGGSQKIYKTTDGGNTWTDTTGNFPGGTNWSQAWYDYYIETGVTGSQDIVVVGLIDVCVSINGGSTWRNAGGDNWTATYSGTAIVHNDQHGVAVNPNNLSEFLIGCDGGVYRGLYNSSTDRMNWTILNRNLGVTQFYTISTHPTNKDYAMGGTQDNATPHSFADLLNWGNPGAGDGAGCVISQHNPAIQYDSYQGQNIRRTNNSYGSSFSITPSWSGHSVPFIGKLWQDPNNSAFIYANTNYLNRYNASSSQWTLRVGNIVMGSTVSAVAPAPGDSNTIYAGTSDGRVWLSTDFGANFVRIDRQGQANGLPNRAMSDISVNPFNKRDVVVVLSGSGTPRAYRTLDAFAAAPVWTSVTGSGSSALPNISMNAIARDLADPLNTWYVGTDGGVWKTTNAGASWIDITQPLGMPNIPVNGLEVRPGTGYLTAATWGRGMWRLRLAGAATTSVPSLFRVVYGRTDTGNAASLSAIDGNVLRICRFLVPNQQVAPVTVEVESTTPVTDPASVAFQTVARATSAGNFTETLDLFDWQANQFVDPANSSLDTTFRLAEAKSSVNASRFIGAGGALKARYQVRANGPTAVPSWCIEHDRASWLVTRQ